MRDGRKRTALQEAGWKVLIVWECETRESESLLKALKPLIG
jgi:G:T-mismatch repair DNA endonuclease (very short patch repair protein)